MAVQNCTMAIRSLERALIIPRFRVDEVLSNNDNGRMIKLNKTLAILAVMRKYQEDPLHKDFRAFAERISDV